MPAGKKKAVVNGFHHVAIRVKDFDETVRFYKEGLGLKERRAWGEGDARAVMLDTGDGDCIEIFGGGKAAPPEGAVTHFALRASDCDAALERARAAGATVTVEPKSVSIPTRSGPFSVRIAFVRSPGGEVIEFFQEMSS